MSDRITLALRDMVDAAPNPPPFPQEGRHVRPTVTRIAAIGVPAIAIVALVVLLRVPSGPEPVPPAASPTTAVSPDDATTTDTGVVRPDPAAIDISDVGARLLLDTGETVDMEWRDAGPGPDDVWSATFGATAFERLSFSITDIQALERTPTATSDDLRLILRLGTETWTSTDGECTVEVDDARGVGGYGLLFTCDQRIGPGFVGAARPFS